VTIIPLAAHQSRLAKQPIYLRRVATRPESQVRTKREVGVGVIAVVRCSIAVPQSRKRITIFRAPCLCDELLIVEVDRCLSRIAS
jgi:hypothetical protein